MTIDIENLKALAQDVRLPFSGQTVLALIERLEQAEAKSKHRKQVFVSAMRKLAKQALVAEARVKELEAVGVRTATITDLRAAWDKYRDGKELSLDDGFLFSAGYIAAHAQPVQADVKDTDGVLTIADYKEAMESHKKLVRQLDVLLNGENAADQASLCDIVAQVQRESATHGWKPILPVVQSDALDAARWRALLRSERIRMIGSAGLKASMPNHYAHFGMEIWTKHSRNYSPELIERLDRENAMGREWLIKYADIAIEAQEAAMAGSKG